MAGFARAVILIGIKGHDIKSVDSRERYGDGRASRE